MVIATPTFRSYMPGPQMPRVIEDIGVEDVEKRRAPTKHYVSSIILILCNMEEI